MTSMDESIHGASHAVFRIRSYARVLFVTILSWSVLASVVAHDYLRPYVSVRGLTALVAVGACYEVSWRLWQRAAIVAEWRHIEGGEEKGLPKIPVVPTMVGVATFLAFPGLAPLFWS